MGSFDKEELKVVSTQRSYKEALSWYVCIILWDLIEFFIGINYFT